MIVKNVDTQDKKANILVEVDAKTFDEALNRVYNRNKKDINIPGFRKGKAPRAIVENMYGKEVFYNEAIDDIGPEALAFGITESKTKYVGTPSMENLEFDDDGNLVFSFSVELYPEAELGQYKEIELEKPIAEVTEDQINAEIDAVKKRNSRMISVDDRAAEMNDTANIDFEGFLDGVPFDGGKAENYNLELGSNSFVPGFEDQIVGMNIGEEKDIDITFPEQYTEELAGKAVVFKVKLNSLTVAEYPEIDDEFAKDVSEFDTLDEYKADIKNKLMETANSEIESKYKADLMRIAAENMKVEIPEAMIDDKCSEIVRSYANNFGMRADDMSKEELAKLLGIDDEVMNNTIKPSAEMQSKMDVLLTSIVKAENIEVSDDEANEYIAKLAEEYGAQPEDLTNYFGRDYIVDEYKKDKAGDLIVETAKDTKGKTIEDYIKEDVAETSEESVAKDK